MNRKTFLKSLGIIPAIPLGIGKLKAKPKVYKPEDFKVSFDEKEMKWITTPPTISEYNGTITVSPSNKQFKTIRGAVNYANKRASKSQKYAVLAQNHYEKINNGITIKKYVHLVMFECIKVGRNYWVVSLYSKS